jgi:hypothetical protein
VAGCPAPVCIRLQRPECVICEESRLAYSPIDSGDYLSINSSSVGRGHSRSESGKVSFVAIVGPDRTRSSHLANNSLLLSKSKSRHEMPRQSSWVRPVARPAIEAAYTKRGTPQPEELPTVRRALVSRRPDQPRPSAAFQTTRAFAGGTTVFLRSAHRPFRINDLQRLARNGDTWNGGINGGPAGKPLFIFGVLNDRVWLDTGHRILYRYGFL